MCPFLFCWLRLPLPDLGCRESLCSPGELIWFKDVHDCPQEEGDSRLTCTLSCRVVDFLLKAIMRTMWFVGGFHWVTVKGRQALPTEAAILTLAPHSSYFDAIPVTMTMSSIVMKAESRDIPIWGSE